MRDIALFLMVFGSIPFILRRPWLGILMWSFISYANPHRLCYGPAFNFPFAQLVALTLFAALLLNRDGFHIPRSGVLVLWVIFLGWMAISTTQAFFPDAAIAQLTKVYKIQVITLLSIALINSRERLFWLVATVCGSLGFYSVKGGLFTISTAGAYRVWGPSGSFIEENNALALASLMVIPMALFIASEARWKYAKPAIHSGIALSLFSVVGSQSRGALVAIIAVSIFLALKSQHKLRYLVTMGALLPMIFAFMPQSWHDRMSTITTYQEDGSAMGRINAWHYSVNIASDRLTGGGFDSWSPQTFGIYAPNPVDVHAAHSIWFGPLGDHGWPGLLLFAAIFLGTWLSLSRLIRKHRQSAPWINQLARMLQVSLVAYFVGGSFLSLAYFDLPWHVMAMAVILARESRKIANSESQ